MQKTALEKGFERELVIERIHFRGIRNNIKMIIRLETSISNEKLRDAVQKLSKTHPLLASRIILDEAGKATFTTENVPSLPLKTYRKDQTTCKEAIYSEDLDPINTETGPLARVILVDHPERPELVLYAHHVACDGMSLLYASRQLLEYLADPGREPEVLTPIPYSEELMRRYPPNIVNRFMINRVNSDWAKRRRLFTEAEYREMCKGSQPDGYTHISFTEEETTALRDRCREESVTVNSALVTAMLLASRATPELRRSDQIAFTVNIRGMLEADPGEACGMYASGVSLSLKYRDTGNFWDNARTAHRISKEKLNDSDALFERRTTSIILDPTIYDAMIFATFTDYEDKLIERFKNKIAQPNLGGILTNLGGVTIPREYGEIRVSDVIFVPPASAGGILAVGAGSVMGNLNLVTPYREPAFKEEVALRFTDTLQRTLYELICKDIRIS